MTFDWQSEYARALKLFGGDTPSATLEQDILDAFCDHPQAVTNAITKIGKAFAAGKIRSPWGALKSEIPKQISRDIHVGDGRERDNAIKCAEQWMINAGCMFDRWSEVQDYLYGDRGSLRYWRNDKELEQRIYDLYAEQRIKGEVIEAEELERAEAWRLSRYGLREDQADALAIVEVAGPVQA